jgi:hypothetical protein
MHEDMPARCRIAGWKVEPIRSEKGYIGDLRAGLDGVAPAKSDWSKRSGELEVNEPLL